MILLSFLYILSSFLTLYSLFTTFLHFPLFPSQLSSTLFFTNLHSLLCSLSHSLSFSPIFTLFLTTLLHSLLHHPPPLSFSPLHTLFRYPQLTEFWLAALGKKQIVTVEVFCTALSTHLCDGTYDLQHTYIYVHAYVYVHLHCTYACMTVHVCICAV